MVGQEFSEFQDKFLDISDTEFVKRAGKGTLDFVTVDGKVYGTFNTDKPQSEREADMFAARLLAPVCVL